MASQNFVDNILGSAAELSAQEAKHKEAETRLVEAKAESQEMVAQLLPEIAENVRTIAAMLNRMIELLEDRRAAGFDPPPP